MFLLEVYPDLTIQGRPRRAAEGLVIQSLTILGRNIIAQMSQLPFQLIIELTWTLVAKCLIFFAYSILRNLTFAPGLLPSSLDCEILQSVAAAADQ